MKPAVSDKSDRMDFRSIKNLQKAYAYLQSARSKMQNGMSFLNNLEFSFVANHQDELFRLLSEELETDYIPTTPGFYFGPKSHFGLRPMSVLPLTDAIVYQAILNPHVLGKAINSRLQNGIVFANRVSSKEKYFLRSYKKQYSAFVNAQRHSFTAGYTYRIVLDVQNYYPSIDHDILRSILETRFGISDGPDIKLLFEMLNKWSEQDLGPSKKPLRRGLPQGYEASDLLANAYLSPVDDFVKAKYGSQLRFFRYNDDMVLMLKSPEDVNRVVADMSSELLKFGLSLNGKSGYHKVEDVEEFDQMAFAPYGEPEFTGVNTTLDLEKEAKKVFEKLNAGKDVDKQVGSKMKYYLRTGGIFSAPLAMDAIELIFNRPEFSFHASEYLEWQAPDKEVFRAIWERFCKYGKALTDWQIYCVARLLGLSGKNLRKYRRWEKLATALGENGHWPMKVLGSVIAKQCATEWGIASLQILSSDLHEPIAWQFLLLLADWSSISGVALPPGAEAVHGSAIPLIRQIYSGEYTIELDDTPPPEVEEHSVPNEIQGNQISATYDGVQELLRRIPPPEQGVLLLEYEQVDAYLHVKFGKREPLFLPMEEQHTHVLHYLIEQCDIRGQRSIGVKDTDIWDYLVTVGPKNGFSVPKTKERRNIKKSIDRHLETLESKLYESFPGLKKKGTFQRENGGLVFNR